MDTNLLSESSDSDSNSYPPDAPLSVPVAAEAAAAPYEQVVIDALRNAKTDTTGLLFHPALVRAIHDKALARLPPSIRAEVNALQTEAITQATYVRALGRLVATVVPRMADAFLAPALSEAATTAAHSNWSLWQSTPDRERIMSAARVLQSLVFEPRLATAAAGATRVAVDLVGTHLLYKAAVYVEPWVPIEIVPPDDEADGQLQYRVFGDAHRPMPVGDGDGDSHIQRMLCAFSSGVGGRLAYKYVVRFTSAAGAPAIAPSNLLCGCLANRDAVDAMDIDAETGGAGIDEDEHEEKGRGEEEEMEEEEEKGGEDERDALVLATTAPPPSPLKRTRASTDLAVAARPTGPLIFRLSDAAIPRPADEPEWKRARPAGARDGQPCAGWPLPLFVTTRVEPKGDHPLRVMLPISHGLVACRALGLGTLAGNVLTFLALGRGVVMSELSNGTLVFVLRRLARFGQFVRPDNVLPPRNPACVTPVLLAILYFRMFAIEVDTVTGDPIDIGPDATTAKLCVHEALHGRSDKMELARLVQQEREAAMHGTAHAPDEAANVPDDPADEFMAQLGVEDETPTASHPVLRDDELEARARVRLVAPVNIAAPPYVNLRCIGVMHNSTPRRDQFNKFCRDFRLENDRFFFGMRQPVSAAEVQDMGNAFLARAKKEFGNTMPEIKTVSTFLFWGCFCHLMAAYFTHDDDMDVATGAVDISHFGW